MTAFADRLRAVVQPLHGTADDYDRVLARAGSARFVLLGEASHGTHEFYRQRALITQRLIAEHGFDAVAVEADWPAAYRVNRYVRGGGDDGASIEALRDFRGFPAWMWRNADVLNFVGWLRAHNDARTPPDRAGFYGLDLYSLHESMEAVVAYLDKVDPEAARRARERYACFESFPDDPQAYGYAAGLDVTVSCEDEVVGQLLELRRRAADLAQRDGRVAPDEFFDAEQNARTVRNAEHYYRTMLRGHVESWNLRDRHMADTLEAVVADLERRGGPAKVVVWAHNSHLGDARATEMGQRGELNVGQLVRERHGTEALLVGFTTYAGTVTAASDWGAAAERKHVRPALAVTKRSSTRSACRASCCACSMTSTSRKRWHGHVSSAPLASSIGLRASAPVTTSTRAWPSSSMWCCTSTIHVPWSRWSVPRGGSAERFRRRFRMLSEGGGHIAWT